MPGGYRIQYHLLPGKRRGCRIHYPDSRVHAAGGISDAAADLVIRRAKSPCAGVGHDAKYRYHHPGAGYPGGVNQLPFRRQDTGAQTPVSRSIRCCRYPAHRYRHCQYPGSTDHAGGARPGRGVPA